MKKGLVTTRGFKKLSSGHPWVLATDLEDPKFLPSRPSLVQFGEHWFFNSPTSQIRLRRFGPTTRNWMMDGAPAIITDPLQFAKHFGDYFVTHLKNLYLAKFRLLKKPEVPAFRWVFSENDLIPGLTVDVLGRYLVAEITTAPIDHFWFSIRQLFERAMKELDITHEIVEIRDGSVRSKEGLEVIQTENPPAPFWLPWNGLDWWVAPASRQKTGFYLDQKLNHSAVREWASRLEKKSALDLFTFQGGFGLHLAAAGLSVLGVDQSEDALAFASKNAAQNKLENFKTLKADVFEWIRQGAISDGGSAGAEKYDVVILDPPSLVGVRENIDNAMRALIDLHSHAFDRLKWGGLLVSCTCSQAFTDEILTRVIRESAHSRRRQARILERRGPSPDHAPQPNFIEGDYLRCYIIQVD
jgi:23S rRNA (cytosine1962-C5)-methyltransferase